MALIFLRNYALHKRSGVKVYIHEVDCPEQLYEAELLRTTMTLLQSISHPHIIGEYAAVYSESSLFVSI